MPCCAASLATRSGLLCWVSGSLVLWKWHQPQQTTQITWLSLVFSLTAYRIWLCHWKQAPFSTRSSAQQACHYVIRVSLGQAEGWCAIDGMHNQACREAGYHHSEASLHLCLHPAAAGSSLHTTHCPRQLGLHIPIRRWRTSRACTSMVHRVISFLRSSLLKSPLISSIKPLSWLTCNRQPPIRATCSTSCSQAAQHWTAVCVCLHCNMIPSTTC